MTQARQLGHQKDRTMPMFNYTASADLYRFTSAKVRGHARYKRFDTAADALQFAFEGMPPELLMGSILEVGEARYDGKDMRKHYEAEAYPLERRSPSTTASSNDAGNTAKKVPSHAQHETVRFQLERGHLVPGDR
jgi:hypothetical protein